MSQTDLGRFGATGDRSTEEAEVVAGEDDAGGMTVVDEDVAGLPEAEGTVAFAVHQVNYTVSGYGSDEEPLIHVFGRTAEREPVHVTVRGFRPYFYAPTEEISAADLEQEAITGSEEGYVSIRQERLTRIYARTPRDVGQVRDRFRHFEADVPFPNRFLIDKGIRSGMRVPNRRRNGRIVVDHREVEPVEMDVTPRVHMVDIEVDDRSGFPEDGEEPILCLAAHDSYRDEYVAWLYVAPDGEGHRPEELPDHELLDGGDIVEVRNFDDEAAMLDDYLQYVQETDFDIACGWNIDDFDAPYLLDRMERLDPGTDYDLSIERFSRVDEVWRDDWRGPNIKGRVVFDLLYGYRRTQFTELDSYRLDAVAEEELGESKERYKGAIGDLWEQDPERLLEYNVRDVELCVEIDRKQEVIAFWNEVRTFVGCRLEDAPTPGDTVDMYILHKVHGEYVLPSRGQVEGEQYEGGAVFDPITGVREMVSVLDLASLYPMAMTTLNASPETKVDPDEYDGEMYHAPNGTHFRQEPDGIIRAMVDELLTEREQKKGDRDAHKPGSPEFERFDRQQAAVKVIMNCFTPDTDVLTPDGVRNIRDLEVGDPVYSLDPAEMRLEVKPVTAVHEYPEYRDELIDIQTGNIDFRVTPNHRMLVRQNDNNGITEDGWSFVDAQELDEYRHYEMPHGWSFEHGDELREFDLTAWIDGSFEVWVLPSIHGRTFTAELGWRPPLVKQSAEGVHGYVLSAEEFEEHKEYIESVCELSFVRQEANRKWIPRTYSGDEFLEFLAWYITEGSVYPSEPNDFGEQYRGSATQIMFAQETVAVPDGGESDHHVRIGWLLDEMGFDYYVDDRGYQCTSTLLGEWLRETCGRNSREKRIPDFVFDCSERQKRTFLEVLIDGDGEWNRNSWRFTTSSERLRDDVLRLCAHLGLTVGHNFNSGSWRLYCTEGANNSFRMHRHGSTSEATDGVFCVSVKDNQSLLAGRDGKYQFIGQSLYGVLGWDRFRLYDREMGAAVTATGREVLRHTEDVADELGYQVVYGDSVTGGRPVVVRDPGGVVRILSMEELFEQADFLRQAHPQLFADGGSCSNRRAQKERRELGGWEALTLSKAGEAEWQPIRQIIRHETDGPAVRLRHEFGESITTRDHSYVVEDDDSYVERPPDQVDEPLRVPGLPEVERVQTIDIYQVLDGYTRASLDGRGASRDQPQTKIKRVHANDEYVWFGHAHHLDRPKTVKVKRFIELDSPRGESLVRLLAAYVSEGSASTRETPETRWGASIASSDREWLSVLREDYLTLFEGATASVIPSDTSPERNVAFETQQDNRSVTPDDRTHTIQMMNELTAVFFRAFAGQTAGGKHVPALVYHLSEDQQRHFLDILVEGDGSRVFPRDSEEYPGDDFDFETTSRQLAGGLSILLTQRGQKHALKYGDEKERYTIRTCDRDRKGNDPVLHEVDHDGYVYDLSVETNQNFVDAVGGIVLHNTDSVMLEIGADAGKQEAIDRSLAIAKHINESYDEFALETLNAVVHHFEIEFEKLYRRFFQAGKKKRYAGHAIYKDGKDVDDVDIVGFEYQRSDIAPITKRVQLEVIEMIVTGDDLDADLERVKEYLREEIDAFLAGDVDLDDIGIPGGIGKRLDNYESDPAHVRGAKYANRLLGTNFDRGSKPKRYYLESVHPEFFERVEAERGVDPRRDPTYGEFKADPDVICVEFADELPEAFEIDFEKMLDKTLKGPISRILEALDLSWEEIKSGQEQTGLGRFH